MIKFSKSLTNLNQELTDYTESQYNDLQVKFLLNSNVIESNPRRFHKRKISLKGFEEMENDQQIKYEDNYGLFSSQKLSDRKPLVDVFKNNLRQSVTSSRVSNSGSKTPLIKIPDHQKSCSTLFTKKSRNLSSYFKDKSSRMSTIQIIHEETSEFQLAPKFKFDTKPLSNLNRTIQSKENIGNVRQKKCPLIKKIQMQRQSLVQRFSVQSEFDKRREFQTSYKNKNVEEQKNIAITKNSLKLCINCLKYVNPTLTKVHEKQCIGFEIILKMSHEQLIDYLNEKISLKLDELKQIQVQTQKNIKQLHNDKSQINKILNDLNTIRLKALKKLHIKS